VGVVRTLLHRADGGFDPTVEPRAIKTLLSRDGSVLWLDIQDPGPADVELLRQEFGFHELALEDVVNAHQRAKIDEYEGYYFVVFYAVRQDDHSEVQLFIGDNYLVTLHRGEVPEIAETVGRWQKNADRIEHGVGVLLYSLLDAVVDGYFPVVDAIAERVEEVEARIFEDRRDCLPDVFMLKKRLLDLRRTLAPERDVLNVLIRQDLPVFGAASSVYFQDVYDHTIRVLDSIDLYRDQLSSLLDAYLSIISNRLNTTMKRMTALATILMSLALIAGIYGMNYPLTPPGDWPNGFWFAIGLMAALGLGLAWLFWRLDWL
jgi:magnesium transporter